MPSFSDSIFIFFLALLLFGPKKLPELARYVGKLLGEFRRASAEFRLQMDDEFRAIEQAEQQKKIAAIEAAAPVASLNIPEPEHPHMPAPMEPAPGVTVAEHTIAPSEPTAPQISDAGSTITPSTSPQTAPPVEAASTPLPIASNGDLHLMPPSTGLPMSRSSSVGSVFNSIPHVPDPVAAPAESEAQTEVPSHG